MFEETIERARKPHSEVIQVSEVARGSFHRSSGLELRGVEHGPTQKADQKMDGFLDSQNAAKTSAISGIKEMGI